ncbi:MAG: hypothetical protein GY751_06765 [Bacteroidetes bacterium]|nr:hypothetical protein [Bacteroidota bacterium]
MYKLLIPILAFVLLNPSGVKAQHTFQQVDSLSYALYLQNDWQSIVALSHEIADEQFDYYYLNIRFGIAHFRLEAYEKAIVYFKKAERNNSAGVMINEYLYWSYRLMNNDKEAKNYYAELSDSLKQTILPDQPKALESVFLSGGVRVANDKSIAGNTGVLTFGMRHEISRKASLLHSYTFSGQSLNWGSYRQHDYFVLPSVELKQQWQLLFGLHYSNYSSNLTTNNTYSFNITGQAPGPLGPLTIDSSYLREQTLEGSYKENDILMQFTARKLFERFEVSPYVALYSRFSKPAYTESIRDAITVKHMDGPITVNEFELVRNWSQAVSDKSSSHQAIIGLNTYYYNKWLSVGGTFYYTGSQEDHHVGFSPYLSVRPMDKLAFSTHLFNKKSYTLALFDASELYNSIDEQLKFSFTGEYSFNAKISWHVTYQHDKITDALSNEMYHLNSFLTGLKIKL